MEDIELNAIDIRFEEIRQKDRESEKRLLASIMERDILEPLLVSSGTQSGTYVLLDGFKRYRCARKLDKGIVPVECIGENVIDGVASLFRREKGSCLGVFEESGLIAALHRTYDLSIYEIGLRLDRSPSWVSMRLGLLDGMSDFVRSTILSGMFPARVYMYGIKGFTRVNNVPQDRVESFVKAVSGKGLGTRKLLMLCRAFFTGGRTMEQLILEGDISRVTDVLEENRVVHTRAGQSEEDFMPCFPALAKGIVTIMAKAKSLDIDDPIIKHEVNYWSGVIYRHLDDFSNTIRSLHDRSGTTKCSTDVV